MQIRLRLRCQECREYFIVDDEDVETAELGCPYYRADVDLPVHDHSGFGTLPKSTPLAISRGRKCCSTWRIPLTRLGSVSPQSRHW